MWCKGVPKRNLKCTGTGAVSVGVCVPTEHKLQVLVSNLREWAEGGATQATQNAVEIQIRLDVYRQHIDADSQCAVAAYDCRAM